MPKPVYSNCASFQESKYIFISVKYPVYPFLSFPPSFCLKKMEKKKKLSQGEKPSAAHLSYLFTAAHSAQPTHLHRSFILLLYGAHPDLHVGSRLDLTAGTASLPPINHAPVP